jgi:hypothetical protein
MTDNHAEPAYPADLDPPRPRRRFVLIVVAVVCVVVAGVALGLVIGLRDTDSGASGITIAENPTDLPGPLVALPAGCDLLTAGQVAALVPGKPTRVGRGPEVVLDNTESACEWVNKHTDPTDPRVQPALLEVMATATANEAAAREVLQISLPCKGSQSRKANVSGADDACLSHKALSNGGPMEVATVSARFETLVVEVSYQRRNWPAWRVDDQSKVTAAALIGLIIQNQ